MFKQIVRHTTLFSNFKLQKITFSFAIIIAESTTIQLLLKQLCVEPISKRVQQSI